jgi:hypothetical protein
MGDKVKPWSDYHTSISTPVTIRGTTYPSIWRAAKALGCHPNNISKARKEGWLDRAGIKTQEKFNDTRRNNHKSRHKHQGAENEGSPGTDKSGSTHSLV